MKKALLLIIVPLLYFLPITGMCENKITYPSREWHLDQGGEVIAVYDVNNEGKTENVRVEYSNPKFLFEDSVKSQIYGWTFPKGNPKKDVRVKINFKKH